MNDPEDAPIPLGLEVSRSALSGIAKAQLRIAIAAIGGALVLRKVLPAWLVNDGMVDLIAGVIILGVASAWSWVRARITHARFASLARDPEVPADRVQFKGETT
jgi:hypothetical protein